MSRVTRMPVAYGALLGIAFQLSHISIPEQFMTAIKLVGDAAIPTIMIILGMQLAAISFKHFEYRKSLIRSCSSCLYPPDCIGIFAYSAC